MGLFGLGLVEPADHFSIGIGIFDPLPHGFQDFGKDLIHRKFTLLLAGEIESAAEGSAADA